VIRKIFLIRLEEPQQVQQPQQRSAYNVRGMSRPGDGGGQRTDEAGKRVADVRIAPKLGRNMKCYCGSGKKYKQCHLPQDGGNPPENWQELYAKAYGTAPVETT
jgi:hypothetical protein